MIEQMRCRYGVFASRGNWELAYGPPLRRLKSMMGKWGASLLVNESRTISTHAGLVRIIGQAGKFAKGLGGGPGL